MTAYATLVLDGGYEEAGEQGRWQLQPGDAVIHAPFSIHQNRAFHRGARLINLLLPLSTAMSVVGTVDGLDDIVRLAKRDATEAAKVLGTALRPGPKAMADVPDLLAHSLIESSAPSIQDWSVSHGIARQTAFSLLPQSLWCGTDTLPDRGPGAPCLATHHNFGHCFGSNRHRLRLCRSGSYEPRDKGAYRTLTWRLAALAAAATIIQD